MDRFDLWLRFVAVTNFFVAVVAAAAATVSLQLDFFAECLGSKYGLHQLRWK